MANSQWYGRRRVYEFWPEQCYKKRAVPLAPVRDFSFLRDACSDNRRVKFEMFCDDGYSRKNFPCVNELSFQGNGRNWNERAWSGEHWNRREFAMRDRYGPGMHGFEDQRWRADYFPRSEMFNRGRDIVMHRCDQNRFSPGPVSHRYKRQLSNNQSRFENISSSNSLESNESIGYRKPHPLSRRGSPIFHLRTFNNWAKVKMIQQAVPDTLEKSLSVMDLGCSKGGDLKKWAHSKVHHVYLVDENEQDLKECQRRFAEIHNRWPKSFNASFFNKDCVYEKIMLPEKVDLVSCQFLVQRAFSTAEEAETFSLNVSRTLKPGGHLIVSLVNADKIKALLNKSHDEKHYCNGVFSVELESSLTDDKCPEFGAKMLFRVDETVYPENLVRMSTLQEVMKKQNLELVWRRSFSELYEEAKSSAQEKRLLTIMGVVDNGRLLMSSAEMETADLYEAAMFKKVEEKTTLADDEQLCLSQDCSDNCKMINDDEFERMMAEEIFQHVNENGEVEKVPEFITVPVSGCDDAKRLEDDEVEGTFSDTETMSIADGETELKTEPSASSDEPSQQLCEQISCENESRVENVDSTDDALANENVASE